MATRARPLLWGLCRTGPKEGWGIMGLARQGGGDQGKQQHSWPGAAPDAEPAGDELCELSEPQAGWCGLVTG